MKLVEAWRVRRHLSVDMKLVDVGKVRFDFRKACRKLVEVHTRFAVVKTDSPNLYKLPIAEVTTDSPSLYQFHTRFAVVKTDSLNIYKPHACFAEVKTDLTTPKRI